MNGVNTGAIMCGASVEDQPHATWSIYMRFTIILLASVAFAGAALADSEHNCVGNANCSTTTNDNDPITNTNGNANTNVNTATGGAGGQGGEGGNGFGIGVGFGGKAEGGNAKVEIERGAFDIDNKNLNLQGQQQQQKASARSSSDSFSKSKVEDSGNSSVYIEGDRYPKIPVASAIAPSASGNCQSFLGASGLIPISSNWCRIVNYMNWIAVNVSKQAAIRYGCISEDDFAEAVGEAMCNAPDQPVTDANKVASSAMSPVTN
jgi:hypothetical protein